MLTEAGRRLVEEVHCGEALCKNAFYVDRLNRGAVRMVGRLGGGTLRLGTSALRKGAPLAGRLGITGVKGLGRVLQWGADLMARRPALALSAVGMPAAYALTRHAPERLESALAYSDPHSRAAAYSIGLLRNSIVPNNR